MPCVVAVLEAVPTYGLMCDRCASPKADAEIVSEVTQHQHHGSATKIHARTGSGLLYISLPVIKPTLALPNPFSFSHCPS